MTLYALAFRCRCGRRPNWRLFAAARELYLRLTDQEPVHTWECQGCGETHVLPASAFKLAEPVSAA